MPRVWTRCTGCHPLCADGYTHEKTPALFVRTGVYACGAKRSRTADLLNAIQALYQLSYSPSWCRVPAAERLGARDTSESQDTALNAHLAITG